MKFSRKVGDGPLKKCLNFGGNPVMDPNSDPDQYCDIGKTCLGGGVQCPIDSGYYDYFFFFE